MDPAAIDPAVPGPVSFPFHTSDGRIRQGRLFRSPVVGGVMVETGTRQKLVTLGIRDSKKLGDARCRELAAEIRRICVGKYGEVIIPPERYNTLYRNSAGKAGTSTISWPGDTPAPSKAC